MKYDQSFRMQLWIYNHSTLLAPILIAEKHILSAFEEVVIVDSHPASYQTITQTATKLKLPGRVYVDDNLSISTAFNIARKLSTTDTPIWFVPYPELLTYVPLTSNKASILSPTASKAPTPLKILDASFFPWACFLTTTPPRLIESLYDGGELYSLAQGTQQWLQTTSSLRALPAPERTIRNLIVLSRQNNWITQTTVLIWLALISLNQLRQSGGKTWRQLQEGYQDANSL